MVFFCFLLFLCVNPLLATFTRFRREFPRGNGIRISHCRKNNGLEEQRERDRDRERERERETGRQTDRQTEGHTERHIEREQV